MTCDTCRSNLILHPGWFPACSGSVFRGCCGFYIQAPFGHLKRNHTDPCRLRQRAKTLLAREKERVRGKDEKFVVFVVYFLKTGSALLHHLLVVPSPCTVMATCYDSTPSRASTPTKLVCRTKFLDACLKARHLK